MDLASPAMDHMAVERRKDTSNELCTKGEMNLSGEDRWIVALERIADALAKRAGIEEKRFQKDFPKRKPKRPAEIMRPEDEKKEQFSDRATDQWAEETEAVVSRFQKRYDEGSKGGSTQP